MSDYYIVTATPNPKFFDEFNKRLTGGIPDYSIIESMFKPKMTFTDLNLKNILETVLGSLSPNTVTVPNMVTLQSGVPGLASKRNTTEYAEVICQFLRDCGLKGFTYFKLKNPKSDNYVNFWGDSPNMFQLTPVPGLFNYKIDSNIERNQQ